jgi:hypothetical protein
MKSNKEILDYFGEKIINNIYDDALNYFIQLKNATTKWGTGKEYTNVIKKLDKKDQDLLFEYFKETIGTTIFGLLGFFEEHNEYKIIYEEDGLQVDLSKISEMLKVEPIIENGWIQRFSKEINKDE